MPTPKPTSVVPFLVLFALVLVVVAAVALSGKKKSHDEPMAVKAVETVVVPVAAVAAVEEVVKAVDVVVKAEDPSKAFPSMEHEEGDADAELARAFT